MDKTAHSVVDKGGLELGGPVAWPSFLAGGEGSQGPPAESISEASPKHPFLQTSGGRLNSSCGSVGQNSWETMVALSPSMLTSWRRRRSGVAVLGTDLTLALMRLLSARSFKGSNKGAGGAAWQGGRRDA